MGVIISTLIMLLHAVALLQAAVAIRVNPAVIFISYCISMHAHVHTMHSKSGIPPMFILLLHAPRHTDKGQN